ncbi:MAG: dTMP kinase [Chloroflexota bacterium]
MSLFITFEGGEGCGKSVQAKALYERSCQKGIPAILTYEPGGTPLGDEICRILKWNENLDITPLTELLLFNASRNQLVHTVIKPNLEEGKVVICDRFTDSTTVYQGYGRGLDMEAVRTINNTATQGLLPSLTILLDLPAEEGLSRKEQDQYDRFEKEAVAFHDKVRRGYLELAREKPERWLVIDAKQNKNKIADIIWRRVSQLLHRGA